MKKTLTLTLKLLLVFMARSLYAEQGTGSQPTYQNKLWMSSVTSTVDSNVLFASGPIVIHAVICGSCTSNNGDASFIQFYKSTNPLAFNQFVTTLTPKIALNGNPIPTVWDVYSGSHTYYDKKGTAEISILWDWFNDTNKNPRSYFNKWPQ